MAIVANPAYKLPEVLRTGLIICVLIVVPALITGGCAGLPTIYPDGSVTGARPELACGEVFADSSLRVVHSMTAQMPDDQIYKGISVTVVYPEADRVKCVIMSIEGMVLFSAESNREEVKVKRAVSPFDNKRFADSLFADIRRVFFQPRGRMISFGKTDSYSRVCRYALDDGGFVDVVRTEAGQAEIMEYSSRGKNLQTVSLAWETGLPPYLAHRIAVYHHGFFGYRLSLDRIRYSFVSKP